MQTILTIEDILKVKLVTSDFRVIYNLFVHGPTRSSELFHLSRASAANFQIILRRLRNDGLIVAQQVDSDGRARVYDLAPQTRLQIEEIVSDERGGRLLRLASQR